MLNACPLELESCEEPRKRGGDCILFVDIARRETFGLDQLLDDFDFITKKLKLSEAGASAFAMSGDSDRGWYGRCSEFHATTYKAVRLWVT